MNKPNRDFNEIIRIIRKDDPRYGPGAYRFLREALDFTLENMRKRGELGADRQLTGQQFLEGIRLFAIHQYGPMARFVLRHWGVNECRDFGNMVFNLVECRVFGKTDNDRLEDFDEGYDFAAVFEAPFRPSSKPSLRAPRMN